MEQIKEQHNHTGTDLIDHLRASYGINANDSPLIRDFKNITESDTTFQLEGKGLDYRDVNNSTVKLQDELTQKL